MISPPRLEYQMEKKMEHVVGTGVICGLGLRYVDDP